jgi:hypothetical protein
VIEGISDLQDIDRKNLEKVVKKFEQFMKYCQKLKPRDSYLIVNRNSYLLTEAAQRAAERCKLNVKTFELTANKPYKHFPKRLLLLLHNQTPKAGLSLFDYTLKPEWNLREVGARIEFLHQTIEQIPIGWGHSPGITWDMAINGPIQCNYEKISKEADLMLRKLCNLKKIRITSPRGTDIEIRVPKQVKFDTDCTIVPPSVYGYPGKFGNLPVGEVWSEKGEIIEVTNRETGRQEKQNYPVKQIANGKLVCDVTAGGYEGKIDPKKPLVAQFKEGVLTEIHSEDPALKFIRDDISFAEKTYGLPTVLEEVGIGLNDKARITGNMLEDEKLRGTCHLAPGNVRCHVDLLVEKPSICCIDKDGSRLDLMVNGELNL